MTAPAWLRCPNNPPCQHVGLLHDIHELDDPRPMCCVDGCRCGRDAKEADDDRR